MTYTYDTWFPRVTSRMDGQGTTTFTYNTYGTSTLGAGQLSLSDGPLSNGVMVKGRTTYNPWGVATETGGVLPDFGFTGHYLDRASGLNLAWYRAYSPTLGRWVSRDPIGLQGGPNLYGYIDGDPVNYFDPLGLANDTLECK